MAAVLSSAALRLALPKQHRRTFCTTSSYFAAWIDSKNHSRAPSTCQFFSSTTHAPPPAPPPDNADTKVARTTTTSIAGPDTSPSFKVMKLYYKGGIIETVNLPTSELLRSASIYARDLFTLNLTSRRESRKLNRVRRTVSEIMPREGLILLAFGNIRAVAMLDCIFLFDAHATCVQEFAHELADLYSAGGCDDEPNELVFLEHVLKDTVESYNRRLRLYEPIVDSFLDRVANEVYSDTGVHQLVPLKDSLQSFEIQVRQALECLTELLNKDDEMLALLLTEQAQAKQAGHAVAFARHEHVELLLGVYARQIGNILMEIQFYLGRVQSKQEFVSLALAGYRNRMIRMNLHIGIAALSLAFGSTVASFFGMNVLSGLEESPGAFLTIVGLSTGAGGLLAVSAINFLSGRRIQERAASRLDEIETLTNALSDMSALEYTVKTVIEDGKILDKDQFRAVLRKARQTKKISPKEVELLFDVFDRVKDGHLTPEDFHQEEDFHRMIKEDVRQHKQK